MKLALGLFPFHVLGMRSNRSIPETTVIPELERQYNVRDPGGHRWTFSETVDDVDPATWGGMLNPDR